MGSLGPSIKSNNPTTQSADISVTSAQGLGGRAYASNVMCAKIDISSMVLAWTDNGASGGATYQKLFTFPEGVIRVVSACFNISSIATSASATTATAAILVGVGSAAAAADATLTSTEVDIIPSTSITLAANAGSGFGKSDSTSVLTVLDGHTTAASVYLNFAASAADSSATVTAANNGLTISGTLYIWYINTGD